MRSAVKPPEATILTRSNPARSSSARVRRTSSASTPVGAASPCRRCSARSARRSDVSSRTPHRSSPSARGDLERGRHRVVGEVDEHGHVHVVPEALGELARGEHGVAPVGGDQPVRDGADAATAPPRRLRVGGDADRPRDVRRPAVAGLHQPVVVAGGEVEDRLAVRRLDDLAHVAHDQRAARHAAEVDGLEVGELRVVALDRHHGLPRLDRVALVQRVDLELLERVDPAPVLVSVAGALPDHRERLVDAAEDRLLALEHLHQHARVVAVLLEQRLGVVEVRVRVVAVADLLDRQPEDRG